MSEQTVTVTVPDGVKRIHVALALANASEEVLNRLATSGDAMHPSRVAEEVALADGLNRMAGEVYREGHAMHATWNDTQIARRIQSRLGPWLTGTEVAPR